LLNEVLRSFWVYRSSSDKSVMRGHCLFFVMILCACVAPQLFIFCNLSSMCCLIFMMVFWSVLN
jgi:hypothetical protein